MPKTSWPSSLHSSSVPAGRIVPAPGKLSRSTILTGGDWQASVCSSSGVSSQKAISVPAGNVTSAKACHSGAVGLVFEKGALPNLSSCNVNGGGTFSWLLDFDLTSGLL